jgi:hypothetical protein
LPHAISKLEPENSILHACEHFAFNYEFFYGKILNSEPKQIVDDISQVTKHYQELVDNDSREKAYEFQLFTLIYLMDMNYFKQHPENLACQFSSRALIFYKFFNYYKKFIDEADSLSINECSLIMPYQMIQGPGSGLILTVVRI